MLQSKVEALSEEEAKAQAEREKASAEAEKKKEKIQSKEAVDRMLKRKKKKAEKIRKKIEERKKNEKKATKRKIATQELLSTETTYVKNMLILINVRSPPFLPSVGVAFTSVIIFNRFKEISYSSLIYLSMLSGLCLAVRDKWYPIEHGADESIFEH